MLTLLAVVFLAWLVFGYFGYGRWIAKQFQLDDRRPTPANDLSDGEDYVPTRPFYLFGQHFSAIAAAGPIAGPIIACLAFGWLPCLIWIALGVVLIGAVHDFSTLTASIRHGAKSVAEITRDQLGLGAGRAMMAFIWIALVYVTVAFTDITAGTFVSGDEALAGETRFNPGGAVALASVLYLGLSILLGLVERFLKPPLWLATIIFVPATFALSYVGARVFTYPRVFDHQTWAVIILLYCVVASLLPVWALLQPRGYLGGFVLYTAIAVGVIGIFFGGYSIQQPAFKSFDVGGMTGMLFPFLFVTIACGACSGFHGLVCSGTTSKQIDKESHTQPVGYGGMLAEGFVAFIALVTVMIAASDTLVGPDGTVALGRKDLRQRHRQFSDACHRKGESSVRDHVRCDGVLDVCLRHARRNDAARPLFHPGADRHPRPDRRVDRDACNGRAALHADLLREAGILRRILDTLRCVEPTARRAHAARRSRHGCTRPGAGSRSR